MFLSFFVALRELYRTKVGNYSEPITMTKDIVLPVTVTVKKDVKIEVANENKSKIEELVEVKDQVDDKEIPGRISLMGLTDSDEFFDVPEPTEHDHYDNQWHSDFHSEHKPSPAGSFVKKLQELAG